MGWGGTAALLAARRLFCCAGRARRSPSEGGDGATVPPGRPNGSTLAGVCLSKLFEEGHLAGRIPGR